MDLTNFFWYLCSFYLNQCSKIKYFMEHNASEKAFHCYIYKLKGSELKEFLEL